MHQAEIQELKQSLRYIEIQLARAKEENETQNYKIMEQQSEIEVINTFKSYICFRKGMKT